MSAPLQRPCYLLFSRQEYSSDYFLLPSNDGKNPFTRINQVPVHDISLFDYWVWRTRAGTIAIHVIQHTDHQAQLAKAGPLSEQFRSVKDPYPRRVC